MRDFRDAKAMAQSLRDALAAKDLKVSHSESLELISKALGVSDWNTLSAAIQAVAQDQPPAQSSPPPAAAASPTGAAFSRELTSTLERAQAEAKQRGHRFLTLEHVLLSLIDDPEGATTLNACSVNVEALRQSLLAYIDNDLAVLSDLEKLRSQVPKHLDPGVQIPDRSEPAPTAGLSRAVQVATRRVTLAGRPAATGSDLLAAMFLNAGDARSAVLLEAHGMTRHSALRVLGTPNGT
jgi:hypothetical protein